MLKGQQLRRSEQLLTLHTRLVPRPTTTPTCATLGIEGRDTCGNCCKREKTTQIVNYHFMAFNIGGEDTTTIYTI